LASWLSSQRGESVSRDWRIPLSRDKSQVYLGTVHQLETSYCMFSVNLDEALGMRRSGRLSMAHQLLVVAPALCQNLVAPLLVLIRAMQVHSRHFGTTPNLAPLNPEHFQNSRNQRLARFNVLFGRILLTNRSQFLYKLSALAEMSEGLAQGYDSAVQTLEEGLTARPDRYWDIMDSSHYDLNTCLRESVVILKCFLHALPDDQLADFRASLNEPVVASPNRLAVRVRHLAHRRLTPIKGQ
jgi:hypothetical protein